MGALAQVLTIKAIPPADAARALAGLEKMDPRGRTTAADLVDLAKRGACFALSGAADAVYVVNVRNGVAWIDALKGSGTPDLVAVVSELIELQAHGCRAVAFQTARPGLVRKAARHGYRVAGWIMRKELQS